MPYLVDSDVLVDYLRHIEPAANYLDSLGEWSVSVVSGLELIAGAKDNRDVAEIDVFLGAYHVVPTNPEIGQLAHRVLGLPQPLPAGRTLLRAVRHAPGHSRGAPGDHRPGQPRPLAAVGRHPGQLPARHHAHAHDR